MAETARKPFNLKEALDGKPVITRDYGMGYYVDTDGRVNHLAQVESRFDLFMEAVEKEAWVNLYPDGLGGRHERTFYMHESEQAANRSTGKDAPARLGGKAHRITWTE